LRAITGGGISPALSHARPFQYHVVGLVQTRIGMHENGVALVTQPAVGQTGPVISGGTRPEIQKAGLDKNTAIARVVSVNGVDEKILDENGAIRKGEVRGVGGDNPGAGKQGNEPLFV